MNYSLYELSAQASERAGEKPTRQWSHGMKGKKWSHLSEENDAAFCFSAKLTNESRGKWKNISTSVFLLNVESISVWKCITVPEMQGQAVKTQIHRKREVYSYLQENALS